MKIAVVTTGRADWNGLGMLAEILQKDGHDVLVLACGQHSESRDAFAVVKQSGLKIRLAFNRVDNPMTTGVSAGYTLIGISGVLERGRPDLVVILGDRYEALMAATAAAIQGIPVAHLDGGDETEGSTDNLYRHAITKLSGLHFCCAPRHARRVRQMGEAGWRVHVVGSTHVDRLLSTPLLSRNDTMTEIGWMFGDRRPYVVVNWQPETAAEKPNIGLAEILLWLRGGLAALFVGQNADPGAQEARDMIGQHIDLYSTAECPQWLVENLKPEVYLSALSHCVCLIGNSSSAYFEAPYVGCWAIDVGARQRGRGQLRNVRHVLDIAALQNLGRAPVFRPYGGPGACRKIADALQSCDLASLRMKRFHNR